MIEFSFHTSVNKHQRFWCEFDPIKSNAVIPNYFNYWIRIDGVVYETWPQQLLIDAWEKEQIWRKLVGSKSSVQK